MTTTDVLETWASAGPVLEPYVTPIRDEVQYRAALELLAVLWSAVPDGADTPYGGLFDTLASRIETYEDEHYAVPDVPPHRLLAFAMEQKGVTQTEVGAATGISQSTLSKLVRGERALTVEQIRILARYFNLDVSAFF